MSKPRQNNFDLLRLALALMVVRCHAALVGWSLPWTEDHYFLGGRWAVQCFFVISGYLIFQSWDRQPRLKNYIEKRARRILPAYVAVLLACTFGLSLLSTLDIDEYFRSSEVYAYLFSHLAFVGFLQNTLPGVFEDNYTAYVNGPLWTIKIEVMFYAAVPIIDYFTRQLNLRTRSGRLWIFALIYALAIVWNAGFDHLGHTTERTLYDKISEQLPGQMSFFVAGALLYYYRPFFERHLIWATIVSAGIVAAYFWTHSVWAYAAYPLALAVCVICFANHFYYLGNFGRYGDFSYGLYILHYPILQIIAALSLPLSPPVQFAVGLTISLVASVISWKWIESRWLLPSSHYVIATQQENEER
ncbi:acyltransferase family protein [Rhodopirellula sallentina]|uniref:Acyltransferase 3 n=1 Tax=Rhodopirellula sallentina SM41 TaxID=1263870 RepID=M5UKQ8_9BACT|nr:acyltransferase [Rhodopirellula sallentina]EMI56598.1 acyltransferase 3 [Rhodopirellula sallentina SM41]